MTRFARMVLAFCLLTILIGCTIQKLVLLEQSQCQCKQEPTTRPATEGEPSINEMIKDYLQ